MPTNSTNEDHPKIDCQVQSLKLLTVVSVTGQERLSRPFRFVIELTDDGGNGPAWDAVGSDWLGKDVSIDLRPINPGTEGDNYISGIVAAAEMLGTGSDGTTPRSYRIEVVPKLWQLCLVRRTRVLTQVTPLDAVKSTLQEAGITVDMRATDARDAHSANLIHITQYDETDLDFISRLLENEGVCYWFEHTSAGSKLIMANDVSGHPPADAAIDITAGAPVLFDPRGVGLRVAMVPTEAKVAAYDYNNPGTVREGVKSIATSKAPVRKGSWAALDTVWASGSNVVDTAAAIEADRHVNRACTFQGFSRDLRFRAGRRVKVAAGEALLVGVEHSWTHAVAMGSGEYGNTFTWVSWGALPWRPPREAPRPRLDAPVPGLVTATAGDPAGSDEAALDGSYSVKLVSSDAGTRVARMAQPYGGANRGIHYPLPPNTEVMLNHIGGNPDMPVIASALPNINDPGPVLEANKTQCVLKTGAGHTMIFEDKDGEEFFSLATKGGHKMAFTDKDNKMVLSCTGEFELTAQKKITLTVGSSSLEMDSDGNITISGQKITLKSTGETAIDATGNASIASSGGDAKLSGVNTSITAQAAAKMSGNAQAEVSSSGQTAVKGSIVMIN